MAHPEYRFLGNPSLERRKKAWVRKKVCGRGVWFSIPMLRSLSIHMLFSSHDKATKGGRQPWCCRKECIGWTPFFDNSAIKPSGEMGG